MKAASQPATSTSLTSFTTTPSLTTAVSHRNHQIFQLFSRARPLAEDKVPSDCRTMRRYGDAFKLTLLTADPVLAARADQAGVDRIGVDLERIGKAERQAGQDTRLSEHQITDLPSIWRAITNAALYARLNPIHKGTRGDIENAIAFGAQVLMLQYLGTVREVETFITAVAGRAHVIILIETAAGLTRMRDILAVAGIDEVMAGLNDLRLELGVRNHFEVLASP